MRQLIGCTDIERLYVSQKLLIMAVWWNGIHRGFKIPRSKDHSGSNPEAATTIKNQSTYFFEIATVLKKVYLYNDE